MKRLKVVIAPVVQEQIREQVLYIAKDSIENALAWEGRLAKAILHLGDIAGGHAIDEEASARLGYAVHKCTFEKTYLIHYRVDRDNASVEVLNFRHGMRLPRPEEP